MNFTNLFIGYNSQEKYRILICADNEDDAKELAEEYRKDASLDGNFEISEICNNIDTIHFDCDYVIK